MGCAQVEGIAICHGCIVVLYILYSTMVIRFTSQLLSV